MYSSVDSKSLARILPVSLLFLGLSLAACGPQKGGGETGGSDAGTQTKPDVEGISRVTITENPNNVLSAIVDVETPAEATVELTVKEGGEAIQTIGPTKAGENHELNVLGLHAETSYQFEIVSSSEAGMSTHSESFTTGSLPSGFPPIKVKASKPDKAADGFRLMSLYRWHKPGEGSGYQTGWGMIVGIDQHGEVVWYYKADHWTWNAHRISNGNLVYIIADHEIVEIDMMGNIVNRWHAKDDLGRKPGQDTYGIHHSVVEQEDGNFVTLSTALQKVEGYKSAGSKANVIGDVAVEFNRQGDVQSTSSLFDVLSDYTTRRRRGSGGPKWNDEYGKDTEDWSHANALTFGNADGTLLASLRHQDWLVQWDRETDELLWRLGPEGDFEFPQGSDGEFNFHQHAPHWLENGNLMVYDNGNFRSSVQPGEDFYTRVVEYKLDTSGVDIEAGEKGTVEQVWASKRPPKYFAPHVGHAEVLPNDTVMVSDGGLLEQPQKCIGFNNGKQVNNTWNCISNAKNLNWARLVEETHDEKKEKVLEVWIKDTSDDPRGYTMYRVEYLESLYPK